MPHPSLQKINSSDFDAIIFDLGGVILPLFPDATVRAFSKLFERDASTVYTQTKQAGLFDELERGEITADEFRQGVCAHFERNVSAPQLDDAWNAMLGSLPEAHLTFLRTLGSERRAFVLSNTNEIHVARFHADLDRDYGDAARFSECFERVHYSHDLKMRKPEPRVFSAVVEMHDLDPARTVFLDDNHANVEAALSIGLQALHHPTNAPLVERFVT